MQISKSDYMLFLKHPAWLWLKKIEPHKLPPADEATQAIFDNGYLFESYAEQLFPEGVRLGFDNYDEYKSLPHRTKKAIDDGATTVLQGRFEAGEITCICDVLKKSKDNAYDLYEIKSSTSAKTVHDYDLAFQKEVLERSGYKINKIFVIHVNGAFVRNGEVTARELCCISEVTASVNALKKFTNGQIEKALELVRQKECPSLSPAQANFGAFSEWLSIYKTLADLEEYSIYHLCSPNALSIGKLEELGVKRLHDIPHDFNLSIKQNRQVFASKRGRPIVDEGKIKKFLGKLEYPLYFLDYETLSSIVPYFDGLGPYMQLPFQYSLHMLEEPGGELKHFEYLHRHNSNPVEPLSRALKSQIGETGTVLVWYEGFEKSCNSLMGSIRPEYKEFYRKLNERVVDLMTPFSNGLYIHQDFFGSASIKKVLPVLIPELLYKDLDINKGDAAQRLWMEAVLDGKRENEKEKILADLLKYCELDTLAIIKIYEFLCNIG